MQSGFGRLYGALGIIGPVSTQKVNATPSKETLNKNEGGYYPVYADAIKPYVDTFGKEVCSSATKLVIFIPKLANCGEPAVYPSTDPKSGEPIFDYNGQPIGYRGFVFVNPIDNCYEVVKGDGTGVIIINQPTQEQVVKIIDQVTERKDFLSIE